MLTEKICNPFLKYQLTGKDPKAALLHVMETFSAAKYDKDKLTQRIVDAHPELTATISQDEWLKTARGLIKNVNVRQREMVHPTEVMILARYCQHEDVIKEFEKEIYLIFLRAGEQWDKLFHETVWSLSESDKLEAAKTTLADPRVDGARKKEIAKMFGLPENDFGHDTFRKLLYDRNYQEAEKLKLDNTDDDVIAVIVANLDAGYIDDAISIAKRFLPHREDLLTEVRQINATVDAYYQ